VIQRTAVMIAKWQLVGFAHGVMNTDKLRAGFFSISLFEITVIRVIPQILARVRIGYDSGSTLFIADL
jgi:hypothetical protein